MTTTAPPLPEPNGYERHGVPGTMGFHTHAYWIEKQITERDAYWLERLKAAEADARRWAVILACVRQGGHGEWVIHEDDPHNADGTKAMFVKAIDAEISRAMGSTTSGAQDEPVV